MDNHDASNLPGLSWEALASTGPDPDPHAAHKIFVARAKVPGGWLVIAERGPAAGLTFLQDPDHAWVTQRRGR